MSGQRGEDAHGETGTALDGEVELGPLGAPDPVALHDLGPLGPLEVVDGLEQLVGVPGDAEEPLLEVALRDEVAGALAGAVGKDLLVGQDGLAPRAPVHGGRGPVGQAGVPEPEEDQLRPLDVLGVMAADLAPPVVDGAEAGQRRGQLGDPGVREDPRVRAGLDGGVLGRQAERVEAERAEDTLAQHGLIANDQVTERVVTHVPLMGRARGVRVHAQRVELLPGVVVVDLVGALVGPVPLPPALHRVEVIGACHATRVGDAPVAPGPSGRPRSVSLGVAASHGPQSTVLSSALPPRVVGVPLERGPDRYRRPRLLAWSTATGGVAQLVERLTGSQEVRGFKSHRLHHAIPC